MKPIDAGTKLGLKKTLRLKSIEINHQRREIKVHYNEVFKDPAAEENEDPFKVGPVKGYSLRGDDYDEWESDSVGVAISASIEKKLKEIYSIT